MNLPINMGLSGAEIEFHATDVTKRAKDILGQAVHMARLGPHVGPKIYMINHDGYAMERLTTWQPSSRALGCENLLKILEKNVWCRPPSIQESFDVDILDDWLVRQSSELHFMFTQVYPDTFPKEVLTHGDPTIANGMLNSYSGLRIIDGLPASAKIPSWREVDEGKVLQSWLGWESALLRAPKGRMYSKHGVGACLKIVLKKPESWFWLAVHCKRILPYTDRQDLHDWCEKTFQKAMKICSQSL